IFFFFWGVLGGVWFFFVVYIGGGGCFLGGFLVGGGGGGGVFVFGGFFVFLGLVLFLRPLLPKLRVGLFFGLVGGVAVVWLDAYPFNERVFFYFFVSCLVRVVGVFF
ncbi:hypothetical protein ACQWKP_22865, partial [Salmonella enterica subsp. enterica serovar Infantis]